MCPRKAKNALGTLPAWEGITSTSAVLEQVSGNSLCHVGGGPLPSPAGCSQEATGFHCLTLRPREKAGWGEREEEEEETEDWFF